MYYCKYYCKYYCELMLILPVVIRVNFFQTELMVDICSKSLVRVIGKVLLIKVR